MNNYIGIHHHFKFERKMLQKPGLFSEVVFEQIPFFKLYPKELLRNLRDVIDVLSCVEMPHAYQKIIRPLTKIDSNHYKDELIPGKSPFLKTTCLNFMNVVWHMWQGPF